VTITLVDDIIKGIQITPHTTDPVSLDLQKHFSDVIPSNFVGKHIDEVKVNQLAESSLAADAFNEAIDQIKQQNRIGPTTRRN
jgi:Cys-tRNA synthase (O-phospho-L-seryl-tRNA:Cys-tRNA synthase)